MWPVMVSKDQGSAAFNHANHKYSHAAWSVIGKEMVERKWAIFVSECCCSIDEISHSQSCQNMYGWS